MVLTRFRRAVEPFTLAINGIDIIRTDGAAGYADRKHALTTGCAVCGTGRTRCGLRILMTLLRVFFAVEIPASWSSEAITANPVPDVHV
jgi:hypothetical protein